MIGLMILGFFAIYLIATVFVTRKAVSWAKVNGKRPWLWGGLAAFFMYNLVFWDWIPTVVAHKYYCATEAGFWEYKTLDKWEMENPGVIESLVAQRSIQLTPYGDLQTLDERFAIETHRRKLISFLSTSVAERLLVDRKSAEVLAKGVDIGSGVGNIATGGGLKFWLNQKPCINSGISILSKEIQNKRNVK